MFTKENIENYFIHFKQQHLFLLMLAVVSLIVASAFYFRTKKYFYKGFSISLFSAAMLLFSISFSNFNNADRLRKICVYDYDLHPENLKIRELTRIDSFILHTNITLSSCIILLIATVVIFLYYRKKLHIQYIKGVASSLFLITLITGIIFFIMKKEALIYKKDIVEFTKQIRVKDEGNSF